MCAPLWATSTARSPVRRSPRLGLPRGSQRGPLCPGSRDGLPLSQGGAYVSAFDAGGRLTAPATRRCAYRCGRPRGRRRALATLARRRSPTACSTSPTGHWFRDTAGSTDCSGTPAVCARRWTASLTSGGPTYARRRLGTGRVRQLPGTEGSTRSMPPGRRTVDLCGVTTCTPLWRATGVGSIGGRPAIGNGASISRPPPASLRSTQPA